MQQPYFFEIATPAVVGADMIRPRATKRCRYRFYWTFLHLANAQLYIAEMQLPQDDLRRLQQEKEERKMKKRRMES